MTDRAETPAIMFDAGSGTSPKSLDRHWAIWDGVGRIAAVHTPPEWCRTHLQKPWKGWRAGIFHPGGCIGHAPPSSRTRRAAEAPNRHRRPARSTAAHRRLPESKTVWGIRASAAQLRKRCRRPAWRLASHSQPVHCRCFCLSGRRFWGRSLDAAPEPDERDRH
jgi:hypothetical protein